MPTEQTPTDQQKRNFLKVMGVLIIGAGLGGTLRSVIQYAIPQNSAVESSFPTLLLVLPNGNPVHTSDIAVNNPALVTFDYPLQNEPNFLLRLGDSSNSDVKVGSYEVSVPATGQKYQSPAGVGPYGSVVAASAICQHLGCIPPELRFHTPSSSSFGGQIHCDCHGSTYDPYKGFSIVTGPTKSPLPSIVLSYDSTNDTYTASQLIGATIYGHTSDLSGGNALTTKGAVVNTVEG